MGIAGPVAAHSVGDTKKTEWVADQRCLTGKSTVWHSGGNVLQAQAITHFSKYLCGHFNSYQGLPKDQLGVDFDFWRDNGKSGPKLCHDGNLRKNTTTAHQMSDSTAVTKTSCGNPGGYVWDYWASAAHKRLINKPATLHTSTSHHPW